jgi:thioredoxin 1
MEKRHIAVLAFIAVAFIGYRAMTFQSIDTATNTGEELTTALQGGRPLLVDFGSNSCTPCRQLRPILQEIKKEQEGKLEVLVIDVNKHQNLSSKYRIQVIPTLVFFDSRGKEMFRQQGFMRKEPLMEQLKKIGVS